MLLAAIMDTDKANNDMTNQISAIGYCKKCYVSLVDMWHLGDLLDKDRICHMAATAGVRTEL